MTAELTLEVSPYEALTRKIELVNDGLVMDRDFVWQYNPSKEISDPDNPDWHAFSASSATFTFTDPSVATFYQLKWAK